MGSKKFGNKVLEIMPELKPYYDPKVIGYYYQEMYGENEHDKEDENANHDDIKVERHIGFFISLITNHLCNEFNEFAKGIVSRSVRLLLVSVEKEALNLTQIKHNFQGLMAMYNIFKDDKDVFKKISTYCTKPKFKPCDGLINHGSEYKPTFKEDVDKRHKAFSDVAKMCRSTNVNSFTVKQNISDFK
jgi:hypothetical protein